MTDRARSGLAKWGGVTPALTILVFLLSLPLPTASAALPVNAGQTVTIFTNQRSFANVSNVSLNCTSATVCNFADWGLNFPINGVAASVSLDLEGDYNVKDRQQLDNTQANFGRPGAVFLNTTGLFGLRTNLMTASPFETPSTSNPSTVTSVVGKAVDVAAGDFDGDGLDDVAVLAEGATKNDTVIQIRYNRGGNFLNVTNNSVIGAPLAIRASDLNRDGRMDLVAATNLSSTLYLYPIVQTRWGGMRPEGGIASVGVCCYFPRDLALGDLSGDGNPDAAVIFDNATVYVMNQSAGKNFDIWGADNYTIRRQTSIYGQRVTTVVASPPSCPNQYVAVGNADANIYIYNQSTMASVKLLQGHANSVNGLAWSPDCTYLASASSDTKIVLWRISNWSIAASMVSHTNFAYSVAFAPNSTFLVSGAADMYLKGWDISSLPPTLTVNISEGAGTIFSLAFSPNGTYLAEGSGGSIVRLRNTADFSLAADMTGHNFAVLSIAYSPDGLTLVSGAGDDRFFVWDAVNFTKTLERTPGNADVTRVAFSNNGSRLVVASLDGHFRLFRTSDYTMSDDVMEGSTLVYGADFERNTDNIFAGGDARYTRYWDKTQMLSIARYRLPQNFSVLAVATAPDGRIATGGDDGSIVISQPDGAVLRRIELAHNGTVNALAWLPGGTYLASAGSDSKVIVWDSSIGSLVRELPLAGNVTTLSASLPVDRLAAGSTIGRIEVWSTADWSNVSGWNTAAVRAIAFDPTGQSLVVGANENALRIWNVNTSTNTQTLSGANGSILAVAWNAQGTYVASGSADDRARLYYTSNWTLAVNLTSHTNDVRGVAFSPDGNKVATAGLDGRVLSWSYGGVLLQNLVGPPTPSVAVLAINWTLDSRRIYAGWADSRFPLALPSVCTPCGTFETTGLAIADMDTVPGNDIGVVGRDVLKEGGFWVLSFVDGGAATWEMLAGGHNNIFQEGYRIAAGDLTGDGRADIAIVGDNATANALYMLPWDSANRMWYNDTNVQSIPICEGGNRVSIADVTDDGHNDVIASCSMEDRFRPPASASHELVVAYYEDFARVYNGHINIVNISIIQGPNRIRSPSSFALGDFNGDGLRDAVTSNYDDRSIWIYRQRDTIDSTFISAPVLDPQLPGYPVLSVLMFWHTWNVIPGLTSFEVFVTNDGGFSWIKVTANQTIDFSADPKPLLQYKVIFHSEKAGISAWILGMWINYVLRTPPTNPYLDIGSDFILDWNKTGAFIGKEHLLLSAEVVNAYVRDNIALVDSYGTLFVPIRFRWDRPGILNLSNLSVAYNLPASPPVLKEPADGVFSDATPTFVLASNDSDGDVLKYQIQLAGEPSFTSITVEFDQNASTLGWTRAFYIPGSDGIFNTPDISRLFNGQHYWWRARAWDSSQWSLWSSAMNFTVDDLAPEGLALGPVYSTTTSFIVTWSATDPEGGAGLAAAPFDLQYKDGLTGVWTDWFTAVAFSSSSFDGQQGHLYCFRMRALDGAGNKQIYVTSQQGDSCTRIDTDRPSAALVGLGEFQQAKNFAVAWSGDDGPDGTGVQSFDVDVMPEGGAWSHWLTAFTGETATYQAASDQRYSFRVAARDFAGNVGDWSSVLQTRVDTSPPLGTVSVPYSTTTSLDALHVNYAFNDPDTGVIAYEYAVGTGAGVGDVQQPVRTTAVLTILTNLTLENAQTYFVSVRALNAAGAWSPWISSEAVSVVIPGPVATLDYPTGVWTQPNITLELSAVDPLGFDQVAGELRFRRATFRFNENGTWEPWFTLAVEANATQYVFENVVRGYAYQFQYRARNEVGSWGAIVEGGKIYVNQVPAAYGGIDRMAQLGETVTLDASSTIDYDGARDSLTYSWNVDDGAQTMTGPTVSLTFSEPGTHRVVLLVFDGHENGTATVDIYVPPPEPVQVLPGFEGLWVLAAMVAVPAVGTLLRRRRAA